MHCVHKAGGWQPKAAGGWFALLTLFTLTTSKILFKIILNINLTLYFF
jgi:hypothetical protein